MSYDQVSAAVIQETVNLLFMQSSVLFSEDVYLVLKSLKLTSPFDKVILCFFLALRLNLCY